MPATLPLVVGLVAGLSGLVLARLMRSSDDVLTVVALVLAVLMVGTDLAPVAVAVAMALVLAGARMPDGAGALALVAAAVLMGLAQRRGAADWLGVLTALAVLVAHANAWAAMRVFGRRPTVLLLAVVPAAIYLAVPDTEQVTAVAVALALAALGVVAGGGLVSDHGVQAFFALTVWATAAGALGRHAAMVGSLACFGVLVVPWLWQLAGRRPRWRSTAMGSVVVAHLAAGAVAARWAGLGAGVGTAAWRAAVVVGAVALVAAIAVAASPRVERVSAARSDRR